MTAGRCCAEARMIGRTRAGGNANASAAPWGWSTVLVSWMGPAARAAVSFGTSTCNVSYGTVWHGADTSIRSMQRGTASSHAARSHGRVGTAAMADGALRSVSGGTTSTHSSRTLGLGLRHSTHWIASTRTARTNPRTCGGQPHLNSHGIGHRARERRGLRRQQRCAARSSSGTLSGYGWRWKRGGCSRRRA